MALVAVALTFALNSAAQAQSITVTADHADGVYAVADTVRWTVKTDGIVGPLRYAISPNQGKPSVERTLELTANDNGDAPVIVEGTFTGPSTLLLKVTGKTAAGRTITAAGGAVAAPGQIAASAPRPDDFDAFWAAKLAEVRAIPADPRFTSVESGKAGVTYEKVTLRNIWNTNVHGQIARPETGEKFPALLIVQWAGVYGLQKSWVTDRAGDGWLAMNISAHDLPIDEPPAFYKAKSDGPLKNYWAIGNGDRDKSYYLRMYLSCVRAVDYLKTRPDWDGKTIVVMGGSQGGMQSLLTAALCPGDITAALANVPAGCDMLGPSINRRGGWPQWYEWTKGQDWKDQERAPQTHAASRYYDIVNFAPRVRCPVLIGAGLLDEICPAAGILAAFNAITSPKELILMPLAEHQEKRRSHAAYDERQWRAWLPALRKGETLPVAK